MSFDSSLPSFAGAREQARSSVEGERWVTSLDVVWLGRACCRPRMIGHDHDNPKWLLPIDPQGDELSGGSIRIYDTGTLRNWLARCRCRKCCATPLTTASLRRAITCKVHNEALSVPLCETKTIEQTQTPVPKNFSFLSWCSQRLAHRLRRFRHC